METQNNPPPIEELAAALKPVLRKGLPLQADFSDFRLLALRGVVARSINPHDRLGRVKALEELLARVVVHLRNAKLQPAAALLFGIAQGASGTTLTTRRERASELLERDLGRFRRAIEPEILNAVAWDLHRDSQNYIARAGQTELPLESSGMTPSITRGDLVNKEVAERAELTSEVWAAVYALRAAILRAERLKEWPDDPNEPSSTARVLQRAIGVRDERLARTKVVLQRYIDQYGQMIQHGAADFNPQGLVRIPGWIEDL